MGIVHYAGTGRRAHLVGVVGSQRNAFGDSCVNVRRVCLSTVSKSKVVVPQVVSDHVDNRWWRAHSIC